MKWNWMELYYSIKMQMAVQRNPNGQPPIPSSQKSILKATQKPISANKMAAKKIPNTNTANQLWTTVLSKSSNNWRPNGKTLKKQKKAVPTVLIQTKSQKLKPRSKSCQNCMTLNVNFVQVWQNILKMQRIKLLISALMPMAWCLTNDSTASTSSALSMVRRSLYTILPLPVGLTKLSPTTLIRNPA